MFFRHVARTKLIFLFQILNWIHTEELNDLVVVRGINGHAVQLPCFLPNIDHFAADNIPDISKIVWMKISSGDILSFNDKSLNTDKRLRLMPVRRPLNLTVFKKLTYRTNQIDNESPTFQSKVIAERFVEHYFQVWDLLIQDIEPKDADEYACDILWTEPIVVMEMKYNTNIKHHKRRFSLSTVDEVSKRSNDFENLKNLLKPIKSTLQSVKLEVLEPPRFEANTTVGHVTVREGDDVTIRCSALGNPRPKIFWFFYQNNKLMRTIEDEQMSIFTFTDVLIGAAPNRVECVANNGVEPASSKIIRLNIEGSPTTMINLSKQNLLKEVDLVKLNKLLNKNKNLNKKKFELFPAINQHVSRSLIIGTLKETTEINCIIRTNPKDRLYWRRLRDDCHIIPGIWNLGISSSDECTDLKKKSIVQLNELENRRHINGHIYRLRLIIQNVSFEDMGLYECVAMNIYGKHSSIAQLTMQPSQQYSKRTDHWPKLPNLHEDHENSRTKSIPRVNFYGTNRSCTINQMTLQELYHQMIIYFIFLFFHFL
ncbi:hypothetical protein SNEBB_010764 [Seison nebaliae]|nr:hypothetical protein SNEBB_010764 [Seison nebaliae]